MERNILTLFLEIIYLQMGSYINLVVLIPHDKMGLRRGKTVT